MFVQLFKYPVVLARYGTGPLLEERRAFLTHLMKQGHPRRTLQRTARTLAAIVKMLGLADRPGKAMTLAEVEHKLADQHRLFPVATQWLRFMGRL